MTTIQITIQNLAPEQGIHLSPFWVGFHEGDFDSYDGGQPTSPELERLVEDRNNDPLSDLFNSEGTGRGVASLWDDLDICPKFFPYLSIVSAH